MKSTGIVFVALAGASLCLSLGCGSSSDLEKVIVEGSVSYQGAPVENGEIRFHPIEGTQGPPSGAPIVGGNYKVVSKGGVPVGKHRVMIEAYKSAGDGGGDMIAGGGSAAPVNYLPVKYHRQSELTIEISGNRSKIKQDYELN